MICLFLYQEYITKHTIHLLLESLEFPYDFNVISNIIDSQNKITIFIVVRKLHFNIMN